MAQKLALLGGLPVRTRPFTQWPISGKAEEVRLLRVLRSGKWGRLHGDQVVRFEQRFAAKHGCEHGIAVVNGTVSLRLALLPAGLRAEDEVVVPPYTFFSTASAVVEANMVPVFVDIDGKTYSDALLAYEDSSVMGIRKSDGKIFLSPAMDTHIESGDHIFALSADDDTIRLSSRSLPPIDNALIRSNVKPLKPRPEKCLILGWNRSGTTIVHELDHYVPKGTQVTVVADIYNIERQIRAHGGKLQNQKLVVMEGETTDRDLLNSLNVQGYDHVIVLAYRTLEQQEADAKTLVTLLHLRDMADKDETPFSIVSEMLDLRNRDSPKPHKWTTSSSANISSV